MTKPEIIELSLIACTAVVASVLARFSVPVFQIGEMWLLIAALLLFQGLIRDLYLLSRRKTAVVCPVPLPLKSSKDDVTEEAPKQCMCLESTFGTIGIAIGAALLLLGGSSEPIIISPLGWTTIVIVTCGMGFLLKNVVIDWKRRRLAIVRDHSKVTF